MSILCIFNILLSKISSQEDIVVGTPIAGRRHSDLEAIIGMFVNTLALRNYPTGEKTVKEFLHEIKDRTLEAFENQEYQFEDLVEQLAVPRDAGRNPLFDVMFNLLIEEDQPGYLPTPAEGEISEEREESEESEESEGSGNRNEKRTAKFDLTLTVIVMGKDKDERILFDLEYCTKLFNLDTLHRLSRYLKNIVSIVAGNPGIRIADIEIMPGEEKRKILYEFNDNQVEYPADKTMAELFEEQVKQTPDGIAVSAPGAGWEAQAITYTQLNRETNRLAHLLRGKGVTPDTIAAIMVERSIEMIIAIYAILKAGAAYLPIDPDYPRERIRFMLQDSDSRYLLTREKFAHHISFDGEVLDIREESHHQNHKDAVNPGKVNTPENLVYMIYTSGSTGKPKGAMVKIKGFTNLMYWYTTEFNINAGDCVFLAAPISFDLAQKNLYAALIEGGTLCLAAPGLPDYHEWSRTIAREHVTIINSAPSVFYPLIEYNTGDRFIRLKSLRYVFLGGEPIQGDKLARWYHSPNCQSQLVNTYGPTECTDIATSFPISKKDIEEKKNIPIGTPIYNVSLYVMDRHRQILPIGVTGELCIGGIGLSGGYHKNALLTAEKFIKTPDLPVKEVYQTGDLARWQADGTIEFQGRVDTQVKVRGNRVELGEIESRLLKHPAVKQVVVTANAVYSGDNYLCAYMVFTRPGDPGAPDNKKEPPDPAELKEYLSGELPDYMIPAYFVSLENIPLTPSGKVDRKALPDPEFKVGDDHAAPGNEIEVKLVEIWSEVLGIETEIISIEANFFELGGHSLKATILLGRIHQAFTGYRALRHRLQYARHDSPGRRGSPGAIGKSFYSIDPEA
jgi:amino acid adenylation domain-containing protein